MRIQLACSSYARSLDDYVARSLRRVAANFRAYGHACPDWEPDGGLYVDAWRNDAALKAVKAGVDVVFFHDADQVIYVDESTDLAELLDIDYVVGAAYVSRQRPPVYVMRVPDGKGGSREIEAAEVCARSVPFPVYWIGAGALWVRAEVFKKLPFPWFMSGYRSDGHYVGEDIFFCEQARAAGFTPMCQPAITTGHVITATLLHRPGGVGGPPPASCHDNQEVFRCVVGDVAVAHFQEVNLARLGHGDAERDQRGDGAPAKVP